MTQLAVGQIGLGAIGQIYAAHLLKVNRRLLVYDLDPSRLTDLVEQGATAAASATELASNSQFILLALPSPDAVRGTLLGKEGVLSSAQPGALVLDLSTLDPSTCVELYEAAKRRDVDYLDAPVSGGEPMAAGTNGARAANITFMVGGDEEAFQRAIPIMKILGKHWFHLGPAGSGNAVKLISNLISGLNNLVAAEALLLGAAAGFRWETLVEVFKHTDARSYQLTDQLAPRLTRRDFEPGFSIDLMYKDHRLADDLGKALGVPVPFNSLATQFYQMLRAAGYGDRDFDAAVVLLGDLFNVDLYWPKGPFSADP